jgi:hypothetical protein
VDLGHGEAARPAAEQRFRAHWAQIKSASAGALLKEILMRPIGSVSFAAVMAMSVLASGASAATKTHHHIPPNAIVYNDERPPLTVNKRSWLDPGPVAPQGSMQNYVTENTIFNQTPDQANYRSRFGNETLPRQLYPTGRAEPLVEFWTPGSPD